MCTKVGVGTFEHVCECLDNSICALLSRSGSVYLYMCVCVCVCVCACVSLCVFEACLGLTLKALWGFCGGCL